MDALAPRKSAEEIINEFPSLTRDEVEAAIIHGMAPQARVPLSPAESEAGAGAASRPWVRSTLLDKARSYCASAQHRNRNSPEGVAVCRLSVNERNATGLSLSEVTMASRAAQRAAGPCSETRTRPTNIGGYPSEIGFHMAARGNRVSAYFLRHQALSLGATTRFGSWLKPT